MFNRTISGLIAKFLFYHQPVVWVEGFDDIPFYRPIVRDLGCRLEPAGGKDNCIKLAQAVIENDYPFVVILDGDYSILELEDDVHQRVITLHKYSIENYLFENIPIQNVCINFVGNEEQRAVIKGFFDETQSNIENNLFELVVLDVANCKSNAGLDAYPQRSESFLDTPHVRCIPERVEALCNDFREGLREEDINVARRLVEMFLHWGRLSDLLRGHLVFGIIRHLIISSVFRLTRHRPNFDNDSLLIMLSLEVWDTMPSRFHVELSQEIRQAVLNTTIMRE